MLFGITEAVLGAAIIGIGTWFTNKWWRGRVKHKDHHDKMEKLPEILEEHSRVHDEIAIKLELAREHNVVSMRTDLLQIHERLMSGEPQSAYWKRQFYDIYTVYRASYGNSWAEDLKRDIDEL